MLMFCIHENRAIILGIKTGKPLETLAVFGLQSFRPHVLAEDEGFEPPQTESESGVLPLHKSSICRTFILYPKNSECQEVILEKLNFIGDPERDIPFADLRRCSGLRSSRQIPYSLRKRGAWLKTTNGKMPAGGLLLRIVRISILAMSLGKYNPVASKV